MLPPFSGLVEENIVRRKWWGSENGMLHQACNAADRWQWSLEGIFRKDVQQLGRLAALREVMRAKKGGR
jgi:hypothetical protein